jgi:4'-phosphopantetheinyl transferase
MTQINHHSGHRKYIYPVIIAVPAPARCLKGRARVKSLSRLARKALEISAEKSHVILEELKKDDQGIPLPFDGNYWSLSHKPKYVGAVISSEHTGIDIEEIKEVSDAMFRRVAEKKEWCLASDGSYKTFFRFWTAKEAVLKATGDGMKGLSYCKITEEMGSRHLEVSYKGSIYLVEQVYFDDHIASVIKNRKDIVWTIQDLKKTSTAMITE